METCNYREEPFSCLLPKNNIHVLTQLSAAVRTKEAHPLDIRLTARLLKATYYSFPYFLSYIHTAAVMDAHIKRDQSFN